MDHNIYWDTQGGVWVAGWCLFYFSFGFGEELIFGNYLKLFIDELFGWPSTALNQTKNGKKTRN